MYTVGADRSSPNACVRGHVSRPDYPDFVMNASINPAGALVSNEITPRVHPGSSTAITELLPEREVLRGSGCAVLSLGENRAELIALLICFCMLTVLWGVVRYLGQPGSDQ